MPAHSYIYNKGNASGASSLSTEAAREGERMGGGGGWGGEDAVISSSEQFLYM